jgi:transcription elongation factor Elf1
MAKKERKKNMGDQVKKFSLKSEFRDCPTCGYKDGFHSMFKKEGKIVRWLLICPACHDAFDIGLNAG